eukprot:TRINITY_DN13720_c0_g2_i2.p1 TRINITY_DN13720_c0_g2~~TRINITY_DN13720_c0_g2_i2.p1  ORF type:complete len:785 (+),score=126.08 TRINITY_DN13720_c0_g2_i2:110-2464(+)
MPEEGEQYLLPAVGPTAAVASRRAASTSSSSDAGGATESPEEDWPSSTELPSTLPARRWFSASQRPTYPTYTLHGVREADAAALFAGTGWRKASSHEQARPPFFARYRRSCRLVLPKLARVRPFPYPTCLAYSCDKKNFYLSMLSCGYTRHMPETYTSVEEFRKVHPNGVAPGSSWYVKTSDGCHGRGVQVFTEHRDILLHCRGLHNEPYVVQRGVRDLHLINDRKWVLRAHVLITSDLRLWLHRDAIVIVHADAYDPEATARSVQIAHSRRCERYCIRSSGNPVAPLLPEVWPQVERIAYEVCSTMNSRLRRCSSDAQNRDTVLYALLGLDIVIDSALRAHCLEVNEFPQMDFSGDPDAHQAVLQTMRDFLGLVVLPQCAPPGRGAPPPQAGGWKLLRQQLEPVPADGVLSPRIDLGAAQRNIAYSTDWERARETEPSGSDQQDCEPPTTPVRDVPAPPLQPRGTWPDGEAHRRALHRLAPSLSGKALSQQAPSARVRSSLADPDPPVVRMRRPREPPPRQALHLHQVGVRVGRRVQAEPCQQDTAPLPPRPSPQVPPTTQQQLLILAQRRLTGLLQRQSLTASGEMRWMPPGVVQIIQQAQPGPRDPSVAQPPSMATVAQMVNGGGAGPGGSVRAMSTLIHHGSVVSQHEHAPSPGIDERMPTLWWSANSHSAAANAPTVVQTSSAGISGAWGGAGVVGLLKRQQQQQERSRSIQQCGHPRSPSKAGALGDPPAGSCEAFVADEAKAAPKADRPAAAGPSLAHMHVERHRRAPGRETIRAGE